MSRDWQTAPMVNLAALCVAKSTWQVRLYSASPLSSRAKRRDSTCALVAARGRINSNMLCEVWKLQGTIGWVPGCRAELTERAEVPRQSCWFAIMAAFCLKASFRSFLLYCLIPPPKCLVPALGPRATSILHPSLAKSCSPSRGLAEATCHRAS